MKIPTRRLLPWALLLIISGCQTTADKSPPSLSIDTVYDHVEKPVVERSWDNYYATSNEVAAIDQAFIQRELAQLGLTEPLLPPPAHRFGFDPGKPPAFYKTDEGERLAEIIVSFQTPSGGWSKRTHMGDRPRRPGEAFGVEQHYIPTFDNGATSTQIWVLSKAHQATRDSRYREAVLRGLKLILVAQYPNGGWPQNFPLIGGYHDHITYNDQVMGNLLELVYAAGKGKDGLDFVPDDLRAHLNHSHKRAIEAVLQTQVIVDGQPTIWGAQHDPRSMLPAAARAFEPEALATAESAHLLLVLMQIEEPGDTLKKAITEAVTWLESHKIHGYEWVDFQAGQSRLQPKAGAGPLWPRFVELGSNRPLFGDRDGTIYYNVDEISPERQRGYAWYTDFPAEALRAYREWKARHMQP